MDGLLEFTAVLIGFLLRLGIPIGVTLGLSWALRRLDARWRREAADEQIQVLAAAGTLTKQECWQIKGCPPAQQAQCRAYQSNGVPCWEVFRENGKLRKTCVGCTVLKRALVASAVHT